MRHSLCARLQTLIACVWTAACAHGIRPAPPATDAPLGAVSLGRDAWTDTSSGTPEAAIYRVWKAYLESKHGQFAGNAGTPSTLWLSSEQAKWPMYDLAGFYLPDGAVPEVLTIRPTSTRAGRAYEIVTRFRSAGSPRPDSPSTTALTMTVYAVSAGNSWVLANALPRTTEGWRRETVGQITYFIDPRLKFDSVKAHRAVAFVDSLALVFGVPRLGPLDYYVTPSVDVALDILGVDLPVKYGPGGGFSNPVNRQLFSGIPTLGEDYRHELTHLVLRPLLQGGTMTILASEGVATWLGGTEGVDFPAAVRDLGRYLSAHPEVTLDSILESGSIPQASKYASGAVLSAMLFDAGGVAAIKEFLLAGPGPADVGAALVRLLHRPWATILADWRTNVERRRD